MESITGEVVMFCLEAHSFSLLNKLGKNSVRIINSIKWHLEYSSRGRWCDKP